VDRSNGTVAFGGFTAYTGTALRLVQPHVAVAHKAALGGDWSVTPSAGVRLYDHNVFADTTAPHVGVVLEKGNSLALRLNHAKGVSYPGQGAPLLNAIVPPLAGATPDGWRSLGAETMQHTEIGVRWAPDKSGSIELVRFDDKLRNRYVIAFPPAVSAPSLVNLGEYSVQGWEYTWQQAWGPALSTYFGSTLLDASRSDLPYIPTRAGSLGLTWRDAGWRVSVDAQGQSGMLTLNRGRGAGDTNTAGVSGFGVLNTRVARALQFAGLSGEAFLAVENLGGRHYAYRPGYPMPERAAQLGVSVKL
jgi:iron complex outermembrane receptor protein